MVDFLGCKNNIKREIDVGSGGRNDHHIKIGGSCNGLVFFIFFIYVSRGSLFLWNPSIRKSRKLPNFRPRAKCKSPVLYGFGYDESCDDHKVFRITSDDGGRDEKSWLDVHSRNTNSWRTTEKFKDVEYNENVYFVRGKLHWKARMEGRIVSLDLTDDTYGEVEQPKYGKN
ncbi:hypothetical protein ACH5RR_031951 [Cinchona calisaya]|uniref:F-box associated beta-propeller type 1 domain-containing protein n=1 Tax=Cinchona calisaya TaxID=153742 RepID=A0ABD2YJE4_9GENT